MWSILEEIGKYGWGRKGYPWVGTNMIRIKCNIHLFFCFYFLLFFSSDLLLFLSIFLVLVILSGYTLILKSLSLREKYYYRLTSKTSKIFTSWLSDITLIYLDILLYLYLFAYKSASCVSFSSNLLSRLLVILYFRNYFYNVFLIIFYTTTALVISNYKLSI